MRKKIMLVVEGRLYGKMLKKAFQTEGFGVCSVLGSGEEAIETARLERPDTVLLDFFLEGDINGIETAKKLRADTEAEIVFLNNRADTRLIFRASEINGYSIVNKLDSPLGEIVKAVCAVS